MSATAKTLRTAAGSIGGRTGDLLMAAAGEIDRLQALVDRLRGDGLRMEVATPDRARDGSGRPCWRCGSPTVGLQSQGKRVCGCGAESDWPLRDDQAALLGPSPVPSGRIETAGLSRSDD